MICVKTKQFPTIDFLIGLELFMQIHSIDKQKAD